MDLINNTDKFIKNVKLGTKDTTFLKFEEIEQNENITKHSDLSEIHKKTSLIQLHMNFIMENPLLRTLMFMKISI